MGIAVGPVRPTAFERRTATLPEPMRSRRTVTLALTSLLASTAALGQPPAHPSLRAPETSTPDSTVPDPDESGANENERSAEEEAPSADAPKVAVVVRGDPDATLRATARALEDALNGPVRLPGDPALRAALRGEGADDGLDRVRATRRGLGLGDDAATLRALARWVDADALVVVHGRRGEAYVEVFDAHAGRYYRDALPVQPLEASTRFVFRTAHAARRRAMQADATHGGTTHEGTTRASTTEAGTDGSAATPTAPSPAEVAHGANAPTEPPPSAAGADEALPPVRAFFKKNWAYFVAGALLVGVVTFFLVRGRRDDAAPQPVLRFRPGPIE